jgi:hypothetical protein
VRIYLPTTLDALDHLGPEIGPAPAHAVTEALRAALPDEDDEGWEFSATLAAADDSLGMLAADPDGPRLRLVVAADVPDHLVEVDSSPDAPVSAVRLLASVPRDSIVSAHVDEPAAARDVVAAIAGDEPARERLEERDLLWYDLTELDRIPR